jgi:quercetin dioxygenase-like cupin family protein
MTLLRSLTAALLVAGLASTATLAADVTRTESVRHDLDGTRQEFVQVRVDLAPGVAFPRHSHPGVEIAYVIKGEVEYKLGDQAPVTLKAGQSVYIPAGTIHSARNVGDGEASELATYLVDKDKQIVNLAE